MSQKYEAKPIDDYIVTAIREFREENEYYPTINELKDTLSNHSRKVVVKSLERLKYQQKISVLDIRNRESLVILNH